MSKGINKRKRTSTGRRLSAVQQAEFNNLTTRYGTPMSVVATSPAPIANRGFYGSYSRRGRSELKVIENAPAGAVTFSSGGAVTAINLVGQGSDFVNRIGRQIVLKSVLLRATITPSEAGTTGNESLGDIARVMLVYDKQPNSAAGLPAVTDILTTADVFSGINLNNRDRFVALMDKKYPMHPYTAVSSAISTGAPITRYIDKYKKLNHDTIFSGTGSTIGNIATGSLLLVFISYVTGTSAYNVYSRVRFTDV